MTNDIEDGDGRCFDNKARGVTLLALPRTTTPMNEVVAPREERMLERKHAVHDD